MKNLLPLIFVFGILIKSCAPPRTIVDTSCSRFSFSEFNRSDIRQKKIAILPMPADDEIEHIRRRMDDRLLHHMSIDFGRNNVRSTQQVMDVLDQHGLSESYSRSIVDYQYGGVFPPGLMKQISEALGVDLLLYTTLLASGETDFILDGFVKHWVEVYELYVQTQIWSAKSGDVVWEGKGGVAHLPEAQADIVNLAAQGLVGVLGMPKNYGPCGKPYEVFKEKRHSLALASFVFSFALMILHVLN